MGADIYLMAFLEDRKIWMFGKKLCQGGLISSLFSILIAKKRS